MRKTGFAGWAKALTPRALLETVLVGGGCFCLGWFASQHGQMLAFQSAQESALEAHVTAGETGPANLIGRLDIPRLGVSVIVMEGDDRATLAVAAGHLRDTALPWHRGNAVIAGHRDTFFRPLQNLRIGDEIRLTSARGTFIYAVEQTRVVSPDDLSPLAASTDSRLTLVTCYPFVYVGAAPDRFIVQARRQGL